MIPETIVGILVGSAIGFAITFLLLQKEREKTQKELLEKQEKAQNDSQKLFEKAQSKIEELKQEFKKEVVETRKELKEEKQLLMKREEKVDTRQLDLDKKFEDIEKEKKQVEEKEKTIQTIVDTQEEKLAQIASLSREEARDQIIKKAEQEYSEDLSIRLRKLEDKNNETLQHRGKELLASVINRLASSTASEITITHVTIPSDDIKGKIIGREGRNIRAFEKAAGVELIIDETPETVTVSSFDPVRRQVARLALENLIADGRIQPAKIEEYVVNARKEINQIIKEKGEQAVHELGILNLDPRIVAIVGRLYFRTSYGQNVLNHSIEMAHLAGMIAEEVGADVSIAKAGALVHDIGKALDHEIPGSHVEIGMRILEKFGADQKIIDAMKSHHDDYPHASVEASIVQTADMISGARPGARRDSLEKYIKRLKDLEDVARSFKEVQMAYALSAGREIRIFVSPSKTSDFQTHKLAKSIAHKIEKDLKYPGEIRITVVREKRVVEYAR